MRKLVNPSERFAPTGSIPAGDFAPLFSQLSRPLDAAAVSEGIGAMSRWLGSPRARWRTGIRS
jgi:hypothetical protein